MCGCPEHAGAEVQIAVTDDGDRQPAGALVRQRDADGSLCVVADAESAAVAVIAMMLVEVQQHPLPVSGKLMSGPDAPIVVLDLSAELRNHALDADRAHVPAVSCIFQLFDAVGSMRFRDLRSASIEGSPFL